MSDLILFGAGSAGRYCLKFLRSKGIEPLCFVDNDLSKWRGTDQGLLIMKPEAAIVAYPDATWVATAISRPAATEIRAQLRSMGVKTKPLYECLEVFHGLPPESVRGEIADLLHDEESVAEWWGQLAFRANPDYDAQRAPADCKDIYFPDFIKRRDDEHFCDAGGGDGDTIAAFKQRWAQFSQISVFEPDPVNMQKIREATWKDGRVLRFDKALSDHFHEERFTSNGDYSSHLGGDGSRIECWTLDCLFARSLDNFLTYIKMDIEGSELEALWGARKILKQHSPVLAICAYHTSDHIWQIPLLIHAIQPDYKLFFRRYAEGAWEIIWYAVPPNRLKNSNTDFAAMQRIAVSDHDCPGVHE